MLEPDTLPRRARDLVVRVRGQVARFGIIGALAFVIDVGLYNVLVFGIGGAGQGVMREWPVAASVIATLTATIMSWIGNRYWTYRHQRRQQRGHEFLLYAVINIGAIMLAACLILLSRRILHLDSIASDNVARLLGYAVATVFRFIMYPKYVFVGGL
ncbi:MAG: GtrA family protein [Terracoccus sp.]